MEVKFDQTALQCLEPIVQQLHTGEQTLELRLPENYPDIGKILGAWGQVLVRSKEWRNDALGANVGVMAWVMYAPEDGTTPRVMDAWMPIQCRWELPECDGDGVLHLKPVLTELDARGLSARKLMLRACVDTLASGMLRQQFPIATPPQLPEDVQLLIRSGTLEVPMEAGEKQVLIDENVTLPGMHKLIYCFVKPEILEKKILGNRLVFRGKVNVDVNYMTEDGIPESWQGDYPFSQFTELDHDHSPQASAWVMPVLTALETELSDGQLKISGGIAAQYTVFDAVEVTYAEDAFSPNRQVDIKLKQQLLPSLAERRKLDIQVECELHTEHKLLSAVPLAEYPRVGEEGLEISGRFYALTDDPFSGEISRFSAVASVGATSMDRLTVWRGEPGNTEFTQTADGYKLNCTFPVDLQIYTVSPISMITEMEFGAVRENDPDRPSLIVCRAGKDSLWTMAKKYGSAVKAIADINKLSGEPEAGQLLLIPING